MSPPLDEYRRKRSPERTPEPFGPTVTDGDESAKRPRRFVVQKHAARRLHYDFRLELHGVLVSWAVPRGPSFDPEEKRLAVHVEDHPVDYADFEGVIPAGNYGAGQVIVWDKGAWIPVEDPDEGLRKGKLLFELRGYKLRGVWQLVKTKGAGRDSNKEWLLIKKPDAWAASGGRPVPEQSVLSGLAVEDVGAAPAGDARAAEVRAELVRLGAPRRTVEPEDAQPMLAETSTKPFSKPGWLFELKYDGFRLLAARHGGGVKLLYRKGRDATRVFPEIARAVAALPDPQLVMDGEVVVLDAEGRPRFERLQQRVQLARAADIERASVELPATLFLFDLLGFEDFDVRPLPLRERKALLAKLLPRVGPLRYADHVEEQGEALYGEVRKMGLEGVIAKQADAPYRAGRSPTWLKVKADHVGDFAIVGYTDPSGSRAGFGALLLAVREGERWIYAGSVGTGFSDAQLEEIRAALEPHRREKPICEGTLPAGRGNHWVDPRLACEVRYSRITHDNLLFHPVFLRLRDDKRPEECVRDTPHAPPADSPVATPGASKPVEAPAPVEKKVSFTNLKKVFWPDEGYTKGDLIEYYRTVAPWMVPWLRDRPLVSTRFPDGIKGKSFYQHDAPVFAPAWLRTERIFSEHRSSSFFGASPEREPHDVDYFICDDEESLLYLANMGTIPIHIWSSRVQSLGRPDWCVLDLDPKGAPFTHVVEVALALRRLCEEIGLPSFAKTSGQAGLHVLVPLGAQLTHEQSRSLGELISRVIVAELPEIATLTRTIAARGGRVYLDYLQNGHGKTIAAPWCVRPVAGAPVSTPLRWSEVNARLDPRAFTIRTVTRRLRRTAREPELLQLTPDLGAALARLGERMRART